MFDANNKAVDYFFHALCQPELDRVHTEHLACRIWSVLKEAHVGNAQVQARMYATYQREFENFTHLPGESNSFKRSLCSAINIVSKFLLWRIIMCLMENQHVMLEIKQMMITSEDKSILV
jgi:hypothetical protein